MKLLSNTDNNSTPPVRLTSLSSSAFVSALYHSPPVETNRLKKIYIFTARLLSVALDKALIKVRNLTIYYEPYEGINADFLQPKRRNKAASTDLQRTSMKKL